MHVIIDPYFFFPISDEDLSDKMKRSGKNIYLTLYYFFELHASLLFQKIYGLGKVKLKIKWSGRFEQTQI
jgi:hypothetical protein